MDIDGSYYCSKCMRTVDNDSQVCPHCGYAPSNLATDSQHLAEGTFLKDRYLIGAVIGAGGFGVTYSAWDENLSVPVAIKEYFPVKYAHRNTEESDAIVAHDESRGLFALGLSRFRKEAQVLAQFQNVPGIVNINECFDENETAYIAMEFVHGVPLDEYVREHKPSPKKLLEIMLPAINALEIIHRQGINHRDIKPDNLLVQEDGSIKLIDFGSAREVEHVTNLIVVSDGYAPLEQYDLKQPQGPWVDVYGISATIYHMLTGVMPEASISRAKNDTLKSPTKLGVKLKKYQEKALIAGLAVDPKKRIQSIAEFRALLYNMPLPEEVRRRKAFVRRFVTIAILTMLLLAVVIVNFACGFPLGEGLLYSLYPDGWHVMGSCEQRTEITIPETRLLIPVSFIADNAFRDDQVIEKVVIPGSIKDIGAYSFSNCMNLTSVLLQWGIERIGDGAFYSCNRLNLERFSIGPTQIPGSVTSIGNYAFYNCNTLEYAYITSDGDLNSIGDYAFADCDRLYGVVLSDSTTHIGEGAFSYCTELSSFELPDNVTSIEKQVFRGCSNLESIRLHNHLKHIGQEAFYNCFSLVEVTFPNGLIRIDSMAFVNCRSLSAIRLPESLTTIGESVFSGCSNLQSAIIPNCWTTIKAGTFNSCSSLTSVDLPDGITCIEQSAFADCSKLPSIELPESLTTLEHSAFNGCTNLSSISLPYSLTYIGDFAFDDCDSLTTITFPPNLASVGRHILSSCDNLTSIIFSDDLTYIADYAFSECANLENITLPDSVTRIGSGSFSDCVNLKTITLPDGLLSIGNHAFSDCSSLSSIILPDSIQDIDQSVFSNCDSLTSFVLPDGISYVSDNLFYSCDSLQSVILPNNLQVIGDDAFAWCTSLVSINLPDSVTTIGQGAFCNCESLTSIVLPDGISSVSKSLFYSCDRLQSVTLPDKATSIGRVAFSDCVSLESLVLPHSVTSISNYAFSGCASLTHISIPASVSDIGKYAFERGSSNLMIIVERDSYAEQFCQDNNLNYVYTDELPEAQ